MKPATTAASAVFALVALLQLLRVLLGWVVTVNGITIPIWASVVICLIAGTLAIALWRERPH
jgi:hypothetical protein